MRRVFPVCMLIAGLVCAADLRVSCSGCTRGKEKLQCDYHVARNGDKSRQEQCRIYADYVNIDGAYPKAAWYYLLAGEPEKALTAAQKGVEQGQEYGREYLAVALWVLKRKGEAREELLRFRKAIGGSDYLQKDIEMLVRLYPKADLIRLLK